MAIRRTTRQLVSRTLRGASVLLAVSAASAAGDPFAPAVAPADLDLPHCRTFHNGRAAPANGGDLLGCLGPGGGKSWSAGKSPREQAGPQTFAYLVAFRRPIAPGSMLVRGRLSAAAVLRSDAPYPPDPSKSAQWLPLELPERHSGAWLVSLPAGLATRAVLLSDRRGRGTSRVESLRIFKAPLRNVTPEALAYAEREHTVHPGMSSPYTLAAASVTTGSRYWQSDGPDRDGRINVPPISDVHATWFMLCWPSPRELCGLWLKGNLVRFELQRYVGPDGLNPRVATEAEWKRFEPAGHRTAGDEHWVHFPPVRLRGLRLRIVKTSDAKIARIDGLHALTASDVAPGAEAPSAAGVPEPLTIRCELPADGTLTMAIDDARGRRVRNLLTRGGRPAGACREAWDLRSDAGQCVPPGTYRWKAIFHPPLKLRYRMCPYPNVEGASPWLNGHAGRGGWLADHTPPMAACAAGDRVYLGAPCAESGVSFIECDLAGRKLWGKHSFAAWTGPRRLATDGTTVFVANDKTDVWGVEIADKKVWKAASLPPAAGRKGAIRGMAAREGKLYLSFSARAWLTNAAAAGDVDLLGCLPKYPEAKRSSGPHPAPDPRRDFLRLLRLTGTPPGMPDSRGSLAWLEPGSGTGVRQHLVIAFHRPLAVGSIAYPVPADKETGVTFSALKAGAPYPPDPAKGQHWLAFASHGRKGTWDVAVPPEKLRTRALRVTFTRGKEDIFTDLGGLGGLLQPSSGRRGGRRTPAGPAKAGRLGRLEGMKILRRRYANVAPAAAVRVNSGKVDKNGVWDAARTRPVSESEPGIYVLQWEHPQKLRGLAIREIDGKETRIDVYVGGGEGAVPLAGPKGWRQVATYSQPLRDYYQGTDRRNEQARYLDGYVDFGRQVTTRAVRLRVVGQWLRRTRRPTGVRRDLGGQQRDATRCRIFGVAALEHLGGETPTDPKACERVVEYDPKARSVLREAHVPAPGELAFGPDGELFAFSGDGIVKVDWAAGASRPLDLDVIRPVSMTFDAGGRLYVFDGDPNRANVRVFDRSGKLLRTIGTPGEHEPGPWDSTKMGPVSALAVDKLGQLWAVASNYWPKRISLWGRDGRFVREFLGPTQYGGGGALDAGDKRRMFYGPLEFALDWETGRTRLAGLTWRGSTPAEDLAVHVDGRTYLVTRACSPDPTRPYGQVFLYAGGRCRLVAAMGSAEAYPLLNRGEMLAELGVKVLTGYRFTWSDRSADGDVQAGEVKLSKHTGERIPGVTRFGRDLSCQAGPFRYEVERYGPGGVPVYREVHDAALGDGPYYRLSNGSLYHMGGERVEEGVVTPDGQEIWSYAVEGRGVHSLYSCGPWHPGQVVAQFGCIGHETAHAGDLGEFLVFHSNVGTWNLWTADGLLAGRIFRDIRDPKRTGWSMSRHDAGMELGDITAGQEHFQGHFCKTPDNRYYVVAGHNHASVVEVEGIDRFRRYQGTIEVTAREIRAARAHRHRLAAAAAYRRAPVLDCYRLSAPPAVDGDAADWPKDASARIDRGGDRWAKLRVGYTDTALYLCFETRGMGPMANTGNDWRKAFKSGAAVDLQIGTDAAAPHGRKVPAAGDKRLLMTFLGDEPTAVLYEPVARGADPSQRWKVASPVGEADFDRVRKLPGVRLARGGGAGGCVVEAAVPLAALGLRIRPGMRLKLDWGLLVSGPEGHEVLQRVYWANQATDIVSDAPSEARLHPDLWGHVRFHAARSGAAGLPEGSRPARPRKSAGEMIDELLKKTE